MSNSKSFQSIVTAHSLKLFFANIFIASTLLISAPSHAGERLFELTSNSRLPSGADSNVVGQVSFGTTSVNSLNNGAEFDIVLPSGAVVNAWVKGDTGSQVVPGKGNEFVPSATNSKVLILEESAGSLDLHLVGNSIAGMTLTDSENGKYYRATIDSRGIGTLAEVDADTILCSFMPKAPDPPQGSAPDVARVPAGITLADVQNLESKPAALHTIYINNWGGTLTGTAWNDGYNAGAPIVFTPYSSDSNTNTFSTTDINLMWLAWAEMSEDYADFDVNITTKPSVYNASPIADRSQIIATTTCYFYNNCGSGGVAFVGVFNLTTDYYKTGWSWNRSGGTVGMTHSHEAGHQMGLSHDGDQNNPDYYEGHGVWGPIMGAPFFKQYVQWSKGEYPFANNFEDDVSILSNVLGTRADDVGDTTASANILGASAGDSYTITQDGIAPDADVFTFNLSSPQQVSIDVLSTLAAGLESRAANAALNVKLEDSSGTVVASITSADNAPLLPTTNTYSSSTLLTADTYFLAVESESPNTNWSTGFGEYGNGGEYLLSVDINPEISAPVPGTTLSGASETFLFNNHGNDVVNYWVDIGSTAGGKQYLAGSSIAGSVNSLTVSALPTDGSPVHVRFWWRIAGGTWEFTDYTYTAATSSVSAPALTTPTPSSTLTGDSETFSWISNGTSVTNYWFYAGSVAGGNQYANSGSLGAGVLSYNASGLPTDGSTVHATLWWKVPGVAWQSVGYTFTAASSSSPAFTSPSSGSTLAGISDTFTWSANGSVATQWWLYLGSTVGGRQYQDTGNINGALSYTANGLPTDGSLVYARLWHRSSPTGNWSFVDDTFVASSGGPTITTPSPGGTVSGTSATFAWEDGGAAVTEWWLYVGSVSGASDIFDSGSLGSALTVSAPMPADGSTVYVRLWYKIGGAWSSTVYNYTSAP